MADTGRAARPGLLARLGLDRQELRAWAMYDWANSAFQCTIITAVFPVYYSTVAARSLTGAEATARFATATTLALTFIAIVSPILGAYADFAGAKKRMLGGCMAVGVAATAAMVFIGPGDWRLAEWLFVIANIGISGSFVFYDSLLPHIAADDEMDRVSTAGYALGYIGGGVLLLINLLWILKPHWFGLANSGIASRLSFLSVAVWWVVFSIPMFRHVPEPAAKPDADALRAGGPLKASFVQLLDTIREFRSYRQAALMLLAFLIYNDGIGTIIRMAGLYGAELKLPETALIGAIVMVQFVGIPCAFLFGQLAGLDWSEARDLPRAHRLRRHQRDWVPDDGGVAVLPAGVPRGNRAGRQSGAVTIALCDHGAEAQVFGVLWILCGVREVCRDLRPCVVRGHGVSDRVQPSGDPVGHRVLRRRSRAAGDGGCGGRPARRPRGNGGNGVGISFSSCDQHALDLLQELKLIPTPFHPTFSRSSIRLRSARAGCRRKAADARSGVIHCRRRTLLSGHRRWLDRTLMRYTATVSVSPHLSY